jgi:beta-lactam-binding protein with PASTA domain
MGRLSVFLPRLVALTVIWLLATTALTYAAAKRMVTTVKPTKAPVAPEARKVVVVPDVRRQAYTFAKGILADAGFAWKLRGGAQGFAANTVVSQSPLPGTRVVDTGAPTIVLQLKAGGRQVGTPESASPFAGTAIQLVDVAVAAARIPQAAVPATKAKPQVAKKKVTPQVKKPAALPQKAKQKTVTQRATWPQHRPPAFAATGATPEPLNEMPLSVRAEQLIEWLDTKPKPTNANVTHWLYQHQWIVTGARMGWWRGAEALKTLIEADRQVWELWGVGARSADLARRTLAEVQARSS